MGLYSLVGSISALKIITQSTTDGRHGIGKALLASQDMPPVLLGNRTCVSHHHSRVLAAQHWMQAGTGAHQETCRPFLERQSLDGTDHRVVTSAGSAK